MPDETHGLNARKDRLEAGMTLADGLLDPDSSDWNGDMTRVFAEYSD